MALLEEAPGLFLPFTTRVSLPSLRRDCGPSRLSRLLFLLLARTLLKGHGPERYPEPPRPLRTAEDVCCKREGRPRGRTRRLPRPSVLRLWTPQGRSRGRAERPPRDFRRSLPARPTRTSQVSFRTPGPMGDPYLRTPDPEAPEGRPLVSHTALPSPDSHSHVVGHTDAHAGPCATQDSSVPSGTSTPPLQRRDPKDSVLLE